MRWIVTALVVAVFAWADFAPQAAWAGDLDRLKRRTDDAKEDLKDAKGDVKREKKDAKEDLKDAKGDVKREKKDAKEDLKRDLSR